MALRLNREEAYTLLAYREFMTLTEAQRADHLLEYPLYEKTQQPGYDPEADDDTDYIEEYEKIKDFFDPKFNDYILKGLMAKYHPALNSYLSMRVSREQGVDVIVEGEIQHREVCPCCGYRTLYERAQFEICVVCYWEDDAFVSDPDQRSGPNHMTLTEGKKNYALRGLMFEEGGPKLNLDPERFFMYAKESE